MASVTFENVTKIYSNGLLAVDRASFTVEDGELMVLVGPIRLRKEHYAADACRPRICYTRVD